MAATIFEGIGIMMALIGASAIESEKIWIPVVIMAVGLGLAAIGYQIERR